MTTNSPHPRDEVPNVPSGTVTFLFTDIEGSTRLLERLHEEYAVVLADQRDLLRAAFAAHNGHEIDTQGDSFFVAFGRALDAVACVADAQRALAEHAWPQGATVRVRMGLHTGEPIVGRTGYVGMDVNRAARIAAAGHGGQVLLSQTTRDLVYQDLPRGLALRLLGEHKLKDIRFPQPIFQLDIEGLPADFPPLKTAGSETPATPGEPPFKGLQYFGEADSELFFGRAALTGRLLETVCRERFLAVVGASGSGKSSLVRAGLVPALRRGGRLHSETASHCPDVAWQVYVLTPTAHPLEALATTLSHSSESVSAAASLMDDMRRDPRSLHLWVQRHLRRAERGQASANGERLLLVLDQFEELFTLCRDEDERRAFVDNLLQAAVAEGGGTSVLLTLRADFYEHLSPYPELCEAVAKHQAYLGAMTAEDLRQAIEAPAAGGGWEFSPGLVELLLHDVGAAEGRQPEPGALPLLSHALLETWQRRRGNLMNLRAYAESGGVRGAIARTAESVFQQLPAAQQAIARSIFLRLTELGEGTQDTRRRAGYDELLPQAAYADPSQVEGVLSRLADARLITTGEQGVEVAHEALIREWPTLREWLNADREGLRLHRHLTDAAVEWAQLGRDPGELYRGARLAQAAEWAAGHAAQLSQVEVEFMQASEGLAAREEAEREAQRQRELAAAQQLAQTEKARAEAQQQRAEDQAHSANRLRVRNRLLTAAGAAALLLAVLAAAFGLQSNANARQAANQQATGEAERMRADSQAALALQAQATAQADRDRAEQAAAEAFSRELAVQSGVNLTVDPELSMLLALAALEAAPLEEGFSALQAATQASRLVWRAESHTGPLLDVVYTPDGRTLVTGGQDGVVRLWEAATGELLQAWEGHTDAIGDLDISRDGQRLATGSDDGTVRVWDMASGQTLFTFKVVEKVQSVAFSADTQNLAIAAGPAPAVYIYNPSNGDLRETVSHPDWLTAEPDALFPVGVVYSPDGSRLAVALDTVTGTAGQVELWDTATGERVLVLPERFSLFRNGLAFSPDGAHLATGWSGASRAAVWDSASGERLFSLGDATNRIGYSSDGRRLLTATGGAKANMWDAAGGEDLLTLKGHSGLVLAVAESPGCAGPPQQPFEWCGRWLASVGIDGTLRLWDVSPMGVGVSLVVPGGGFGGNYGFSDDGQRLNTLLPTGPQARDWLFQQWRLPDEPGGLLADYTSHTVSLEPGVVFFTSGGFSRPGRGYVHVYETGRLVALDISGATVADFCCVDKDVVYAELSGDLRVVVVLRSGGVLEVWDLASEQRLSSVQLPALAEADPEAIATNHAGTRVALVVAGGLSVLDSATGEAVLERVALTEPFYGDIHFSRHQDAVIVLDCAGNLTVFELASGRPRLSLSYGGGCFIGADISEDGTQIAAATVFNPLKVWDTTTATLLFELPAPFGIGRPRFSPDGRLLYAAVVDNQLSPTVRAYFTQVADLVAFARSRLTRGLTQAECKQYLRLETCP
jgi:WD40 repeat protein/class 3 adenylate cyclase